MHSHQVKKLSYLRFKTTHACNMRCYYCHQEGINESEYEELSPDHFETILAAMIPFGLDKLTLVGGEPMLCKFIEQYIDIAFALKVPIINITTNGSMTYAIRNIVNKFPELNISISVPSFDESEYQFITGFPIEDTLSTINYLNSIDKYFSINMVIDSYHRIDSSLLDTIEHCHGFCKRLKLIIPCNDYPISQFENEYLLPKLMQFLENHGFRCNGRNHYQFFFEWYSDSILLVTSPYCPNFCRNAQLVQPTLRMTPTAILKPCLLFNDHNIKLPLGKISEMSSAIEQALDGISLCHLTSEV